MARVEVAVLMVTYNSCECIEDCLKSVFATGDAVSKQVIVVDNGSSDGTQQKIQSGFRDVKLIEAGDNLGFAAGVNLAAKYADAEFVLLLNPDTV
ncbi:MAG: glycosyltransferase, partial [Pseudomonadota bacterium]